MAWLGQKLKCISLKNQRQEDLEKNILERSVGMSTMCMNLWVNASSSTSQSLKGNKIGVIITVGMIIPTYVTSPRNCKADRMLVVLLKAQLRHELGNS